MTLGPGSFRHRLAKGVNDNVSSAINALWIALALAPFGLVLPPLAAIVWGAR